MLLLLVGPLLNVVPMPSDGKHVKGPLMLLSALYRAKEGSPTQQRPRRSKDGHPDNLMSSRSARQGPAFLDITPSAMCHKGP